MDYTKLIELMEKEDLTREDVFEFYNVKNENELLKLINDNFSKLNIQLNDTLGYISPEMIYDFATVESHNIFYEKLMVISYFLRAFSGYTAEMIKSFVVGVGLIQFVFTAEKTLNDKEEFSFFKKSYQEYKQDKYFKDQAERFANMFDDLTKNIRETDFTEVKKLLDEFSSLNK